ncbi:PilC/PilY family type IV pilus protein [Archangium primigenium]|uniref:PilC/PilY family type IV pilus protein n=1 Tax=[Archangium] primigenium TaxID=2792470 RepID=UPI00195F0BE9|nr:PilC/PilY family type IV pilus protein [Archangium primigenium]MBM7114675.1 pilus assembly protein PilY [Archangium primigenium]
MFRKLTLCLVVAMAALLRADTAAAVDQAACCLPTTSRLDSLMNPVQGGDEKFFSKTSGPPNILFIIDTSGSMHAWPTTWPTTRGCNHAFFNELGYKPDEVYPRLWTDLNTQSNDWFATSKYYTAPTAGYGVAFQTAPVSTSWANVNDACGTAVSSNAQERADCRQCLDTKGYYIQDGTASKRRVKGNFLNFYAPRDSGAVKVLADVVRDLNGVRFGVMAYETATYSNCWGPKSNRPTAQCLCIAQNTGPTCDKSYPLDNTSSESNRSAFLRNLTNQNGPLNGLGWDSCNTPLSDALYAAGYYFQSKSSPTPFTTMFGSTHAQPVNGGNDYTKTDGVCFECGFNAVILLTDGEPYDEGKILTLPAAIRNDTTPCTGCGTSSALHKVAKFLWEKDLRADKDGQQSVATYTIGFSEDVASSKLLQETARLGGGSFHSARSTSELKQALVQILDNINSRSNAFSSAAVNNLQSQGSSQLAILPRMVPSRSRGWAGKLYRFEQFSEFVEDVDKNNDGDRNDIFLVDKQGRPVAENDEGEFRRVASFSTPTTPAVLAEKAEPFWEAGESIAAMEVADRKIYTVTDNGRVRGGSKDGLINQDDGLVEFNLNNFDELRQYLSVTGAPICPTGLGTTYKPGLLLEKMKVTFLEAAVLINRVKPSLVVPELSTQANYDRLCAALIIQYVRGQDLFDEDGDGLRSEMRASALGDIFHSTPAVVNPPVEKFMCELGVSTQCVRTLYANNVNRGDTPLMDERVTLDGCQAGATEQKTMDAYSAYQYKQRLRQRLVLVGANDGMLHAIRDATGVESTDCSIAYPANSLNAGKEAWAFIPSDLLPRLQEMIQGHAYYVDGDIMVRDIWVDENNDNKKSSNEFHTVAVVAEGRGGTHYFALDLRWDPGTQGAVAAPRFRWMFPQPCTDEAMVFGKTLFSLSGKPPPIGPVLLDSVTGIERNGGTKSAERWVTMLSGGWSPGGDKGRGVYMVDVWNGKLGTRKDNLLWKWEYSPSTSNAGNKPREHMRYGFVSPVQMTDYGDNQKPSFDGFADTAVVGDLGGQLWTLRFFTPGIIGSAGLVENWSGARSFSMDRQDTAPGGSEDISKRAPFFYSTELALQLDNKALRAFVGTGNRYSVLDDGVGVCRFDNPQACSKLGCTKTQVDYKVTRNSADVHQVTSNWDNRLYKGGTTRTFNTPASYDYCGSATNSSFIKASFEERDTYSCPKPTSGSANYEFANTSVECGQQSGTGVFDCRVKEPGTTLYMGDVDVKTPASTAALGKNRFFGLWAYGGNRVFDENPGSASPKQAREFDAMRLTDRGGVRGSGDLVNVTDVSCTTAGACTCATSSTTCNPAKPIAAPEDAGWFYEYEGLAHKTASGSSVFASCTVWNSMYSAPAVSTNPRQSAACSGSFTSKARLYQGDFISGAPNCAVGFANPATNTFSRYQERSVVAPPPDPAMSIQVSKAGGVRYSTVFFEPGPNRDQASQMEVSGRKDILQYIYELPVPRGLHNCRHVSVNGGRSTCMPSEM